MVLSGNFVFSCYTSINYKGYIIVFISYIKHFEKIYIVPFWAIFSAFF